MEGRSDLLHPSLKIQVECDGVDSKFSFLSKQALNTRRSFGRASNIEPERSPVDGQLSNFVNGQAMAEEEMVQGHQRKVA